MENSDVTHAEHHKRIVLVTGGAGGIGAAIVRAYLQQGASVGIVDFDHAAGEALAAKLASDGHRVHFAAADVADFAQCAAACEQIGSALGAVDTLINNAGISPKHQGKPVPFWEMEHTEWQRVMDVNITSAFNFARILTPGMVARRYGRIVSMSSVAGKAHLDIVAAHYSTTKAAVIGFTRHLAGELGPYGITANALAPGRINTPLVRGIAPEANDAVVKVTPLGRLGLPEEVANACVFLTSAQADFITGQTIDIAGGWLMT